MVGSSQNLVFSFAFGCTACVPNFRNMHSWVGVIFVFVRKEEGKKTNNKNWNFGHLYLRNNWRDLLKLWNVASCYRWALQPQIWCSSDTRSQIYKCVKIVTLLFLLIYVLTPVCARSIFLGCTINHRISWYSTTVLYDDSLWQIEVLNSQFDYFYIVLIPFL